MRKDLRKIICGVFWAASLTVSFPVDLTLFDMQTGKDV
ncbi:hypothetical protein SELR_pSRC101210 (plasmid) [Selenomonas ruminantium subsp. lactilytica TAM6421]|uniref:Uncharacterized protein n=1 Tax=Selenomonas ruminantium subsp. lactilytica (strain NBRC 103574 / TAM6421) TaxID=927704 RepID=I0GVZ1_SELRL|nr:hypothetical protein SELR_pSRC101210 [Selenomonas ruminantium subsp. lactilytica TAM6421]